MSEKNITLFESKEIRKIYHEERWFFSVVDVVGALTDSTDAKDYWYRMKNRVKSEDGIELSTICRQLKLLASDGKKYATDCADTEALLRIIQSIPSPKAEPFKIWLAKVGYERLQEVNNPEMALDRSRELWKKYGRSEKWIQQRMTGQETRNKLTDYWSEHGVEKGEEFAILTNIIHEEWTGIKVGTHKNLKWLAKSHNLRDHMSEEELLFTALAELSTRRIAESMETVGLVANKVPAKKWGKIARDARVALEEKTGKSIITGDNFLRPKKEAKKLK
jgi:DNA-damage-inducible protein D